MSLEQNIMGEMKTAMLAKNDAALRGLRAIKSAILIAKTADGQKTDITEDDEIKILQKLAKQRRDSLDIFVAQNREDLAQKEREELDIIEKDVQLIKPQYGTIASGGDPDDITGIRKSTIRWMFQDPKFEWIYNKTPPSYRGSFCLYYV
jgi:hypothetical protein